MEEYSPAMSCGAAVQVRQLGRNLGQCIADHVPICSCTKAVLFWKPRRFIFGTASFYCILGDVASLSHSSLTPQHLLKKPPSPLFFTLTWLQRGTHRNVPASVPTALHLLVTHTLKFSKYIFQLFTMKWTHEGNCKKGLRTNNNWYWLNMADTHDTLTLHFLSNWIVRNTTWGKFYVHCIAGETSNLPTVTKLAVEEWGCAKCWTPFTSPLHQAALKTKVFNCSLSIVLPLIGYFNSDVNTLISPHFSSVNHLCYF